MYREKHYDYSGVEAKWFKDELKKWGFHHATISSLPADFFRMSKSQLEKLFEHASDAFISKMYDVPIHQIQNRRSDYDIKQFKNTLNRMEREDENVQVFKEILRIVSNEYNNGNIPHTNSTPLNSEKEFLYMKATGIVRRIDDLGRVVIPKEIRRTLRIREGDSLEIFTDRQGEIILKKYSPIGELSHFAKDYAESLANTLGTTICITDHDQVIAAAGYGKKELQDKYISKRLESAIAEREQILAYQGERKFVPITEETQNDFYGQIINPVICEGDVLGSVILLEKQDKKKLGEMEQKVVTCASNFLGRQMEQ